MNLFIFIDIDMERRFALGSIIIGSVIVLSILFYRLFIGLNLGWNILMIFVLLCFYVLLIVAGVNLLRNKYKAIPLYRFFSWGIIIEYSLMMYLICDYVDIMLTDYVPLICALPFIIMYPRK